MLFLVTMVNLNAHERNVVRYYKRSHYQGKGLFLKALKNNRKSSKAFQLYP